jgi:hypothetical protein
MWLTPLSNYPGKQHPSDSRQRKHHCNRAQNIASGGNDTKISRSFQLEKLIVELGIIRDFNSAGQLDLSPVDFISNLELYGNSGMRAINLFSKATAWKDFSLYIETSPKLSLFSLYHNVEKMKGRFWYWPKGDILGH